MEDAMYVAEKIREPAQINAVALKAYARVVDAWGLNLNEAAGLADMTVSTWKRAKKPDFAGELTKDQLLRLSAVIGIYKSLELYFSEPLARSWFTRPNTGPLFGVAVRLIPPSTGACRKFSRFGPILMHCAVGHEADRDF